MPLAIGTRIGAYEVLAHIGSGVTCPLQRFKRNGAVAVKFEIAYLRTVDIEEVPVGLASDTYSKYVSGGLPSREDYKRLQDFLFRHVALECGTLGLAVHIHVSSGSGTYFANRTANPLLLEGVFNDPLLRTTSFVIVHGGWPLTNETRILLGKPNVYADFSAMTFLMYARELSSVLRGWLEFQPEKVLFGTNAVPLTAQVNWEETGWLTVTTARQALSSALDSMMADGEITRDRALELARLVLRENAARLYGFEHRN